MIAQQLLGKAIQGLNDFSSAAGDIKLGTLLASLIQATICSWRTTTPSVRSTRR
jgi:hypothetical protein